MKVSNETMRKAHEWAEEVMNPPHPHHLKDAVAAAAKVILSLPAPGPPTLAELVEQGHDPEGYHLSWVDTEDGVQLIVMAGDFSDDRVYTLDHRGYRFAKDWSEITPLPDLPPMEWPAGEPTADYAKGGAKKNLEEPSQPEKLETPGDYRNAPVGTEVAAIDRTLRGLKKGSDRLWRIGTSNFGSDSEDMGSIARDVTYWPGEK